MNASDDSPNLTQSQRNLAHRDRFVDDWRAGREPSIEAHLDLVPEPDRRQLLRELIEVEVKLRRRRGEQPTPSEYKDRFLDHALVDAVFVKGNSECQSAEMAKPSPGRSKPDTACNLLFGILALQNTFIDRAELLSAFNVWTDDKTKPLGRILVEQGKLDACRHELLNALVVEHLKLHDNNPDHSLAALSPLGPVRRDLEYLADPDLAASLGHLGMSRSTTAQPDATVSWVGTPTSTGARFRVLRPHAKGGLGEVFAAFDEELHREVALKRIQEHHADDPDSRARFIQEAEITGGLEHPGVVPVYGLGHYDNGRPFYAMRLVKGDSQGDNLRTAIKLFHDADQEPKRDPGERSLALRRLLGRFLDVCNAVAYAHSRGVLHRDLKPGNILLGKYGETLIIDWGLAKVVGRPDPKSHDAEPTLRPSSGSHVEVTQAGSAIGTPGYMSPEQASGDLDRLGPRSDVFSLGATLYNLLTGRSAFEGQDFAERLRKNEKCEFPPPGAIQPSIPRPLEAICLKAMARQPEDRYSSIRELARDIERWMADEPVSALRDPLLARAGRWARRHKPLVAGAAVLLITALVALSIGIVAIRIEQSETEKQRAALKLKSQELSGSVESLRKKDYISRINLALRECDDDNVAFAEELLDGCPEDLRGFEWFYVKRQCHLELKTFARKSGQICSIAFSPNGEWLASGSGNSHFLGSSKDDGELVVRDVSSGRELFAHGLRGRVNAVAFSPDSRWIASGNAYGDADKAGGVTDLVLWNAGTGEKKWLKSGLQSRIVKLKFTPDGRRIVAGFRASIDDPTDISRLEIWDLETGAEILALPVRRGSLNSLDISPDGKQIALAGHGGIVDVYDLEPVKLVHTLAGHKHMVNDVAFSPDGKTLASCGWDLSIKLWDRSTGRELRTLGGHQGFVRAVCFSADGSRLISTGEDRRIKIWELASGRVLINLHGHTHYVYSLDHCSASGLLASGSIDGTIKLWWPTPSYHLTIGVPVRDHVVAVNFSGDGGTIIAETRLSRNKWQWNATTGERIHNSSYPFDGSKRGYSAAGMNYAVAKGKDLEIRESATGKAVLCLEVPRGPIKRWAFSPDGTRIVVVGGNDGYGGGDTFGEAQVWEIRTGRPLFDLVVHSALVSDVAYSPDGRRIATASNDRTVKLWDAQTGQEVFTLRGHVSGVLSVSFSPDGGRIATGGMDATVRLWDSGQSNLEVLRQRDAVVLVESLADQGITLKSDLIQRLRSDATIGEPLRSAAVEIARRWDTHKVWQTMRTSEIKTRDAAQNARDVVGTLQLYQKVLARRQALVAEYPDDTELRSDHALAHQAIANLHFHAGRLTEALRDFQRVSDIYETLTRLNPNATGYAWALAWANWMIGIIHHQLSQPAEALRYYERTRDLFENLIKSDPHGHLIYTMDLLYGYMGELYRATGRLPEASRSFERAIELDEIWNPEKNNPTILMKMARHQLNLGHVRGKTGRLTETLRLFHQAQDILQGLPDGSANDLYNLTCSYSLVSSIVGRSEDTLSPGDHAESQRIADLAVATLRRAVLAGWKNRKHANQDTDLDPLRSRPDFQELMMDISFPDDPFAQ